MRLNRAGGARGTLHGKHRHSLGSMWARVHVEALECRWLLAASYRFAVIGDYGVDNANEAAVANLVSSWNPSFVITVGDNQYVADIDRAVGKYYQQFIGNYAGSFGPGSPTNRFFPSLGNHDWDVSNAGTYLNYFTLPGNERYYDFVSGQVHFFAIDSDTREPNGRTSTSLQGQWLQSRLAASTAPFQVVYFHHAPYSSGSHGGDAGMRWPFESWGADAVLTGHDHNYERLAIGGIPYFVDGSGGASLRTIGTPVAGSQFRYDDNYGALLVTVSDTSLTFEFYSISNGGTLIDRYVYAGQVATPAALVAAGAAWKYLDNGTNQGTAWRADGFNDGAWRSGNAQLGYGDGDEATLVSYGADANNKYVTTYFRHTFQVANPAAIGGLTLRLLRDDGAVVYLNGQEVARSNMPAGTVASSTLASTAIGGTSESTWYDFPVSPLWLVTGANVLAVEVHQGAVTSSDVSFDAQLISSASPEPSTAVLLSEGSAWRYHAQGANLGTAWRGLSYSDSAWPSGYAELGYGDGGEVTVVPSGPTGSKYITTYFRRSFNVPTAADWSGLTVRLKRDDGAVVYLNGLEVVRSNMPGGTINYTTTASSTVGGGAESTFYEFSVPASRLRDGTNLLAVEIHQSSRKSSDISFDLGLTATRAAGAASLSAVDESSSEPIDRRAQPIDSHPVSLPSEPNDQSKPTVNTSVALSFPSARTRARHRLEAPLVDAAIGELEGDLTVQL